MTRYVLAATMATTFILLATGCSEGQPPTVTFKSAAVDYIGAEGFTFNFVIDLHNPNDFAIPLQEATYTLYIGDTPILQGKARPPGTIPARGDLEFKLPVSLSWTNVLGAEEAIRARRGDIPFTLEGTLAFDASRLRADQPTAVPLRYSGVVPVRQILHDPMVILRSPAAKRLAEIAISQVFSQASQPASQSSATPPQ